MIIAVRALLTLACVALVLVVPGVPATAQKAKVTIDATYEISIAGWGLARAELDVAMEGGAYDAYLFMRPKGVARIVTAVRTTVDANGRVRRGKVLPSSYSVRAEEIRQPVEVDMVMNSGNVQQLRAVPPLKRLPGRVRVTGAHKRNIVDPLSAGLIPFKSADGRDACNHRLKIFDGWTRYDVTFSYAGMEQVKTKGYSGRVVACNARWVPISGHRPRKREVQYLKNNKRLKIWLLPLPSAGVAIPYKVSIGTPNGTILIEPSKMNITGAGV